MTQTLNYSPGPYRHVTLIEALVLQAIDDALIVISDDVRIMDGIQITSGTIDDDGLITALTVIIPDAVDDTPYNSIVAAHNPDIIPNFSNTAVIDPPDIPENFAEIGWPTGLPTIE